VVFMNTFLFRTAITATLQEDVNVFVRAVVIVWGILRLRSLP
jgi:hypothetical protein